MSERLRRTPPQARSDGEIPAEKVQEYLQTHRDDPIGEQAKVVRRQIARTTKELWRRDPNKFPRTTFAERSGVTKSRPGLIIDQSSSDPKHPRYVVVTPLGIRQTPGVFINRSTGENLPSDTNVRRATAEQTLQHGEHALTLLEDYRKSPTSKQSA